MCGGVLVCAHAQLCLSSRSLPPTPPTLLLPSLLPPQIVDHERSDLQESATRLVRQLAEYTITLKQLEDNLLARLAASQVRLWRRGVVGEQGCSRGNTQVERS